MIAVSQKLSQILTHVWHQSLHCLQVTEWEIFTHQLMFLCCIILLYFIPMYSKHTYHCHFIIASIVHRVGMTYYFPDLPLLLHILVALLIIRKSWQ